MFTPHTKQEIQHMLSAVGVSNINDLFSEVPKELLKSDICDKVPEKMTEMQMMSLMQERASLNKNKINFMGAGAYEHYVPAAVVDIISRGEYLTAYTPYQPEASQGSLQLIYEYQTMMSNLVGAEVSNASMYDGATALAEAILMSCRVQKKKKSDKVILSKAIHPHYRQVVETIVKQQDLNLIYLDINEDGTTNQEKLQDAVSIVIQTPNFLGVIENSKEIIEYAKNNNILTVFVTNPMSCSIIAPPGELGADIVCGEGQPLGIPLSFGGPYFGFLCCKKEHVRQLPGRLVGKTKDSNGKTGFCLTLQAREQHIRRLKACSNICTNQGLLVVAATVYMSLQGAKGLQQVALKSHSNAVSLSKSLSSIKNIKLKYQNFFNEFVIELPSDSNQILQKLSDEGIYGGVNLEPYYPEYKNRILVCATETKTQQQMDLFKEKLEALC